MSKREEMRKRRQQQTRQRQLTLVGGVVVIALAVVSFLVYQNTRPIGEIKTIEKQTLPFVDGKTLGAPEARVVMQEFSDFQ